jgi:hypothetical protein
MSNVSFLNTDITGIRFSDNTKWGGEGDFQVIEEEWLEEDREKPMEERSSDRGSFICL